MKEDPVKIRNGIFLFKGKLSRNLMFEPIVSNVYFIEDGEEVIIFDPSCGKKIGKRVETHIRQRIEEKGPWKKATIIAGHSHLDHANNFYWSDVIDSPETNIFVHEKGFLGGKVMNQARPFLENTLKETNNYYNFYLAFAFPYNLLMLFFVVLNALSPALARKVFSIIGSLPWPSPSDGKEKPVALKNADIKVMNYESLELRGWVMGNKIILPTPGHSPCSVSLYWPEQKALFISDADWIGNPVFLASSVRDSLASLNQILEYAEAGYVELLLPAHGNVKEGSEQILSHIRLRIRLLEAIRDEVIAGYWLYDKEKDIRKLTKILTQESPLFKMLKIINYQGMCSLCIMQSECV